MTEPMILVTGSAGKTGSAVVGQMLDEGFRCGLLSVARTSARRGSNPWAPTWWSPIWLDLKSVRAVVQGVRRIYFVYPPQGALLVEATTIIAVAARDASVEALVNMSQISVRQDSESPLARQHWLSENILDWADIGAVHIRPTFFAENLFTMGAETIASVGKALPALWRRKARPCRCCRHRTRRVGHPRPSGGPRRRAVRRDGTSQPLAHRSGRRDFAGARESPSSTSTFRSRPGPRCSPGSMA